MPTYTPSDTPAPWTKSDPTTPPKPLKKKVGSIKYVKSLYGGPYGVKSDMIKIIDEINEKSAPKVPEAAPAPVITEFNSAANKSAYGQIIEEFTQVSQGATINVGSIAVDDYFGVIGSSVHSKPAPAKEKQSPASLYPNLLSFVLGDLPLEQHWTNNDIAQAIESQGWRERSIGETIIKGDLMHYSDVEGSHFERVQGLENLVFSEEHRAELMNYTVFTCDGSARPKRKPLIIKETGDFRSIYEVPKGIKVNMPTSEGEAKRFFGCDVIRTDYVSKGKSQKVYYPVPVQMANRRFRSIFSRIFSDFTKTYFRQCIKSVIPCRGEGFDVNQMRCRGLKHGISTRKIRQMMEQKGKTVKGTFVPMTTRQIYDQIQHDTRLDTDTIDSLLRRQDYQPQGHKISHNPYVSFLERMNERKLAPDEYQYDKALGIEIEAVSTMNAVDLQRKMPHWVRVVYDGSLRDNKGGKLRPTEDFSQKELAKGLNGLWGVEFQILVHRRLMETQISRVLNIIGRTGCYVNQSCGLHVHFDMRDKTLEEAEAIADKVNDWLMILKELLPKARRNNVNCAFENPDKAHHAAVATDSYAKHKTIEVRVHSGTISPIKIFHWIRLIDVLIAARYVPVAKSSCLDSLKILDLTDADRQYWLKRHHQLNPDQYAAPPDLGFLGNVVEIE